MIRPTAFANAITTMMVVLYLTCATLSILFPNFLVGLAQSWVHTLNIEIIKATTPMTFGSFMYGLLSAAILTWVVTYATTGVYRYFVHREQEVAKYHRGYMAA